jgi:hypothetical protein
LERAAYSTPLSSNYEGDGAQIAKGRFAAGVPAVVLQTKRNPLMRLERYGRSFAASWLIYLEKSLLVALIAASRR